MWNVEAVMKGRSGSRLTMTATIEAHDKDINHLSIAPNDSLVATASGDKTAKVRNSCGDRLPSLRLTFF